uniref:Uncharacterized protein n=1 Tax=Arundo donax TaxID=35708 RepID=A0A0A8Y191_ARUDO
MGWCLTTSKYKNSQLSKASNYPQSCR